MNYRTYHGAALEADFDIQFDIGVAEIGDLEPFQVAVLAPIALQFQEQFIPAKLLMGFAWERPGFSLNLDANWTRWSHTKRATAAVVCREIPSSGKSIT